MIVKCTESDIQKVGNFYDDVVLYLTQHVNYPKWMYKNYPSMQSVAQAVADGTQYMCVQNGKVVGAFVLNTDPQGDYHLAHWGKQIALGNYLVIHSFATAPNLYRTGIATKMLQFCIQTAKFQQMQAIRLDVVPTNYPAAAFYQKHGFSFVEELDLNRGFEDIPTFCVYELNL